MRVWINLRYNNFFKAITQGGGVYLMFNKIIHLIQNIKERKYKNNLQQIKLEDLKPYEKDLNIRIRNDNNYKILHDKIILISPFGNPAKLYYYDDNIMNNNMNIIGEWNYIGEKYIIIYSRYKN
jgi:hypothetical protein